MRKKGILVFALLLFSTLSFVSTTHFVSAANYDFGGFYGNLWGNPVNQNLLSCPAGYTVKALNSRYYFCYRDASQQNFLFGGFATSSADCPADYTSFKQGLPGGYGLCHKTGNAGSSSEGFFGGMYSTTSYYKVSSRVSYHLTGCSCSEPVSTQEKNIYIYDKCICSVDNPLTNSQSCPAGFTASSFWLSDSIPLFHTDIVGCFKNAFSNNLQCSAVPSTTMINQLIFLSATGGAGTYSWNLPGGTPSSGTGPGIQTSYSAVGTKTATVTSSGTAGTCYYGSMVSGWRSQLALGDTVSWTTCRGNPGAYTYIEGTTPDIGCVREGSLTDATTGGELVTYDSTLCGTYDVQPSATASCNVLVQSRPLVEGGEPECSNNQIIMRLYTETNSHVSKWDDATAGVPICYNQIFGGLYTSADPHVCSPEQNPNNVVLRNNSAANAHVEGPRGATAGYSNLCYGDLNCEIRNADQNCQENWALVAYLSSGEGANKHVSKSPAVGWLKLCCHSPSHSNPAQPRCGNERIEGTEECDPPTAPDSSMQCTNPSKSVCNSTCSCEALPPTPPTKDIIVAEWRDANPVHEHVQVNKSALNGEVYLYGLTRYYDPGTLFTIEVFNTLDNRYPVATFNLTSNSNGEIVIDTESKALASLTGGVIIDGNLYLNDFVGNDAQLGQNFTFKISHETDNEVDDFLDSSPIEVIPDGMITNWVNECGLINQSLLMGYTLEDVKALCIKSESSSILRNPDMCIDGSSTAKCAWNDASNTCYNQITLVNAATGERGICSYNVNYKTECSDTGFREAEVTTDYTGDPVCAGDCTPEGAITSIPCSRAFLSLPFFAAWQIAGAIVVLFFVYLVLIKTGIIGKKNSKKIKNKRR